MLQNHLLRLLVVEVCMQNGSVLVHIIVNEKLHHEKWLKKVQKIQIETVCSGNLLQMLIKYWDHVNLGVNHDMLLLRIINV